MLSKETEVNTRCLFTALAELNRAHWAETSPSSGRSKNCRSGGQTWSMLKLLMALLVESTPPAATEVEPPGSEQRGCLVIQTSVFSPELQQVGLDWSFHVLKQCYLKACRRRNLTDIADAARLMASAAGPSAGLLSKYIASVISTVTSQLSAASLIQGYSDDDTFHFNLRGKSLMTFTC